MGTLRFCLFGKFSVYCQDRLQTCFQVQRVQELLCYLLLHRDKAHHREILADTLWNETETPHSKKYLRKTLWQLQSALTSIPDAGNIPLLEVLPQWVQVAHASPFWLDVAEFEEAYTFVQGKRGRELSDEDYQKVEHAVQLYQGDLLEGWFQDWCIYERERFKEMYLVMVDKLMGYCEHNHIFERGLEYGKTILNHDRAREHTHRRMMMLYYLSGNRSAALQQFETCKLALHEELDVEPGHRTLALLNRIAEDKLHPAPTVPVFPLPDANPDLLHKLARVKKLLQMQATIQQRLFQEFEELEQNLEELV